MFATIAIQLIAILLAILCFLAFSVGMFQIFGHYFYSYRLTDKSLDCVLLGFVPVIRIRYDDITSVSRVGFAEADFFSLWFANRLFGKIVLIRNKSGSICITPDEADTFVETVKARVRESAG
jgi:hypothetical protein